MLASHNQILVKLIGILANMILPYLHTGKQLSIVNKQEAFLVWATLGKKLEAFLKKQEKKQKLLQRMIVLLIIIH